MRRNAALFWTLGLASASTACIDPKCPPGYLQGGDTCYRCKVIAGPDGSICARDAGVSIDDAGTSVDETDDDASDSTNDDDRNGPTMDAGEPARGQMSDAAVDPQDGGTTSPREDAAREDAAARGDTSAGTDAAVSGCSTNPCQHGGSCMELAGSHRCMCSSGYTGPDCAFRICGTTSIQTRAELEAAADCGEIDGDLNIGANFGDITSADLPNLEIVRGKVAIGPVLGPTTPIVQTAQKVTLPALTSVEGNLAISGVPTALREFRFPSLTTIGTPSRSAGFNINGYLWILDLRNLRTVYGSVIWMTSLCSLDIRNIQSVSGDVGFLDSPRLPFSSALPLINAAKGAKPTNAVGCCNLVDRNNCAEFTADCSSYSCP